MSARIGINGFGRIDRQVLRDVGHRSDGMTEVCIVGDIGIESETKTGRPRWRPGVKQSVLAVTNLAARAKTVLTVEIGADTDNDACACLDDDETEDADAEDH